jgi:cyanate permease
MLFSLVQVFAAFGVPALADRSRVRRPWLVLVSTVAGLAALGILMLAGALLLRPQSREVPPV